MTYVGFSRVRGWAFIKVAVDEKKGNKIVNIVWKEALLEATNRIENLNIRNNNNFGDDENDSAGVINNDENVEMEMEYEMELNRKKERRRYL